MILLIDNYDSFTGNLYQLIIQQGFDVTIKRNDKITKAEVASLNPKAIVISPGPGRPEAAGNCIEIVKEFGHRIPTLGVCLGHQVITVAFAGEVAQACAPFHGKTSFVFHHRQGIYQDLPLPFQVGRYHSLISNRENLPNELVVEAETGDGLIMGIRHAVYPVFGVQFHPESILTPQGAILVKNFLNFSKVYK